VQRSSKITLILQLWCQISPCFGPLWHPPQLQDQHDHERVSSRTARAIASSSFVGA